MANRELGAVITFDAADNGVSSGSLDGTYFRGALIFVNISAITGTNPTLTVTAKGIDPVSGGTYTILASTALNATGFTVLRIFPGATAVNNLAANDTLPPTWRIDTAIGGSSPEVTATISVVLIG